MDWINVAKYRDKCRAFVNAVMKCGFHKMRRNFWLVDEVRVPQGQCFMELVSTLVQLHCFQLQRSGQFVTCQRGHGNICV